MKLLTRSDKVASIVVKYNGIEFIVPEAGYIAVDKEGDVYWYENEPTYYPGGLANGNVGYWYCYGNNLELGVVDLDGVEAKDTKERVGC